MPGFYGQLDASVLHPAVFQGCAEDIPVGFRPAGAQGAQGQPQGNPGDDVVDADYESVD